MNLATLTPRQQEIAELVAHGLTNPAIANRLGISPETVSAHVKQAARRVGGDTPARHRLTVWFYASEQAEGEIE